MKAHLVSVTLITRVVVPDDATQDQIDAAGLENLKQRLNPDTHIELRDNLDSSTEDTEMPFNQKEDNEKDFGYYSQEELAELRF